MTIVKDGAYSITYSKEEESHVHIVSFQVIILICAKITKGQVFSLWTLKLPYLFYTLLKLYKRVL